MPQPVAVDRVADPLVDAYRNAWEKVLAEQQRLVDDPVRWVRRRRLEEMSRSIARLMDTLDSQTAEWIGERFPRAYLLGLTNATGLAAAEVGWTAIHQQAVEELAYRVYDDLLEATRYVRDSTKALVRTLGREVGTTALIRGDTAQGAGRIIAKILEDRGIAAITYRNGARHGLASYSEMLMRTTTALGYNVGTLNATPDIKFYECFDGPKCGLTFHEDTTLANGLILERDEALAYPISHPNCRRSWGARPDVTSRSDIPPLEANPVTVGAGNTTLGQRSAQLAQDRQREARQARTARTRRTARQRSA